MLIDILKIFMNPLFHFLLSYVFVDYIFKSAKEYFLIILISSTFLDLDHIFYTIEKKEKIIKDRFGAKSRTIFHEILGMFILYSIISILYFVLDEMIVKIFSLSLILHYSTDFLIGKSRPFYPYSKKEVQIIKLSRNSRIIIEIILTMFLLIIFYFCFR